MQKRSVKPQRGFFPQPAYLVGCFGQDGRANFALNTWITVCSTEPPGLVLTAGDAHLKKTAGRILETGVFSANLVTESILEAADYCGVVSGHAVDKVETTGLSWGKGAVLDVPVLDDSPWVYECMVIQSVRSGDGTLFLSKVESMQLDEGISDPSLGKVDIRRVAPVIYAHFAYYSLGPRIFSVGESLGKFGAVTAQ
ncbi:MAG: flavin reductase family protein [Firmicutes bacterium]|nr:flavin reductase family protein [Bacillota bacterium]